MLRLNIEDALKKDDFILLFSRSLTCLFHIWAAAIASLAFYECL